MNKGGFSLRRFLGISAAQARLSRAIGIPLSRSGRQRKLGAMMEKFITAIFLLILAIFYSMFNAIKNMISS
jgi:hypothetical protein